MDLDLNRHCPRGSGFRLLHLPALLQITPGLYGLYASSPHQRIDGGALVRVLLVWLTTPHG